MNRFVWLFLAACSSTGGSSDDPDGGGGSGGENGGSNQPTETKAGILTISSTKYTVSTTDVEQGYASGTFYRIPPTTGTGGGGCTTKMYDACEVMTCTFGTTTTDGGLSITYTDAGPIKISGVLVNDGTMTLTPGGYGYVTVSGAVALFNGGANVRFLAPGNPQGAPAFDVSLVAPSSVQVTAPAFVQGTVNASASSNLQIAWSGSSAAEVTAQLAAGTSGMSAIARCHFPGNAGGGTVPAAAIAAVKSVGGSASIIVMSESRTTKKPDGWDISFSLQTYGLIASGIAAGSLTIQ